MKILPQSGLLEEVVNSGLVGAAVQFDTSDDQIQKLYQDGSAGGRGSVDEFKMIICQYLIAELELRRDELLMAEWIDRVSEVNAYLTSKASDLISNQEISLNDTVTFDDTDIPKFYSGFHPLDNVLGGLYQGILTIMAKSGHGKTSLMLSLMESLRNDNVSDEMWFFECEIPARMMMYRLRPARKRTRFTEADRIICGSITSSQILARVREKPNQNRIIFVDSPDVMAGGMGEMKRFGIEAIYRDLVAVKELSQLVVVASQIKRGVRGQLSMEAVSEAWTKVHYSDMLVGATKLGKTENNLSQVRFIVPKNRFGRSDQETTFGYNYADLTWKNGDKPRSTDVSEEDW